MALVSALTADPTVRQAVRGPFPEVHTVASTRSWERLVWLVRERPVTAVVVDSGALPRSLTAHHAVSELRRRFPSLSMVFVVRPGADPVSLFRLGRAGLRSLVLVSLDQVAFDVAGALRKSLRGATGPLVARAVSPFVPAREVAAVKAAMDGALRGWSTEEVAAHVGLTRPHLSVRLKTCGLPSAGQLLVWAKVMHASRWLTDPGRSAESISRQLEYSSGAAFRRALRTFVGATPTQIADEGGLRCVLPRFLDACGLSDSVVFTRSVA